MEKTAHFLQIKFRIHQIAQTVSCAGNGNQPLFRGASIEILFAHLARDKIIIFAMEENDRQLAVFNCIHGSNFIQIKMTEEPSA